MQPDPATADDPRSLLLQACENLRRRLLAGEDCQVEQLLAAYPALASDPDMALALIRVEWVARQDTGRQLSATEWQLRFPEWSDHFQSWLTGDAPSHPSTADGKVTLAASGETAPERHVPVQSLDHHELGGRIGQGGMGTVYRAWDPVLKRHVALKKIRAGVLAGAGEVERFYREARAAAQLHHPNLVPVFGMGLHRGEHCFTMALVAGGSLDKQLGRYRDEPRKAAALIEAVARGVQAAHDKDVIHRDLKPGNILLDEKGQPLVSDFGLARSCTGGSDVTLPGQVMGTPAYMAPEQAAGRIWQVGPASDVWALGVILYELLTGRRPFEGEKAKDVLPQVLEVEPPQPRQLRPSLDRDLETIVLKCLEKDQDRRYASAAALADDLGCWLAHQPIQARPRPWYRKSTVFVRPSAGARKLLALLLPFLLMAGGVLLILPAARPTAGPEPKPKEKVREALQRNLAAGKPVTLVGRVGLPAWYLWRTEKTRPPLARQRSGPLFVESWERGLLELLPAAPPRFRLRGEVKLGETLHGSAGLYMLGEERLTPSGPQHFYCALMVSRAPNAPDHSPADRVELHLASYREQNLDRKFKVDEFRLRRAIFPRGMPGVVDGWCKLVVEVTPEALTVRLGETLLSRLPRRDLDQKVRLWWMGLHSDRRAPPAPPVFPPHGGLGLFVYRSTARFRNVVVEPLPKP